MPRWIYGVLLALFVMPTLAAAAPEQRGAPDTPPPVEKKAPADDDKSVTERDEFQLDADSEVLLDGSPSRYEDIPPDAIIKRLQVARDGTVVRIEFRSRNK